MLVGQLAGLASRALARTRRGQRIPVHVARAPGPRPHWPTVVPDIELEPGRSAVSVRCCVPGATPENVLVCWDEECHSICVRVARATCSGASHDFYVELPLPANVDGTRSRCTLEGTTLLIRAPCRDTPARTGLVITTLLETVLHSPGLAQCA